MTLGAAHYNTSFGRSDATYGGERFPYDESRVRAASCADAKEEHNRESKHGAPCWGRVERYRSEKGRQ
jgi:hypothetical protein